MAEVREVQKLGFNDYVIWAGQQMMAGALITIGVIGLSSLRTPVESNLAWWAAGSIILGVSTSSLSTIQTIKAMLKPKD